MIFSVHIPKTAGTSFARALEARFGKTLAFYYGVHDPKTTEGLRVPREELAGPAGELAARGFECLHGHYHVRNVLPLIGDPANVWTWLRDPVERTLSQFDFFKERPLELKELAERVKAGEVTVGEFAAIKSVRDLQARYLKGFELANYGFVGITEHFELGLASLFGGDAPTLKRRYNATNEKAEVTPAQRNKIAALNARDMRLYAEGLRLFVDRLAAAGAVNAPERPAGLLKRLAGKVA